jgi:uncharacterized membrane-anchored protein YitT (DUF2179 family)/HD superfamily phosphodiesterase
MQSAAAISFILDKLAHELSSSLTYHNLSHTERVIQHVSVIAEEEGVIGHQRDLLLVAAAYHDAGFIEVYNGHEEVSCRMAREYLPGFNFNEEDIEAVCEIIMATKIPQTPTNFLGKILCDADLYYLGTSNYETIADTLFDEFLEEDILHNKLQWQEQQTSFLKSHQYFTKTARKKLGPIQEKNLLVLATQIESPHTIKHHESSVWDIIFIIAGVIITAFGLKGFLVPNQFFDGGITGISLMIHEYFKINLAYVIVAVNIPFVIISYFSINKGFAIKTFFAVTFLGICLLYPSFPTITDDKLLISIFGGFFLGIGIGLTMRAGCAVDGIEVLALYTLRRSSFTISEIILGINIIIFSFAAFHFGPKTALYSMLTYFIASKTIDYVIEGLEAYTGVTIISGKSAELKHRLVNEMGKGITVYKGERGFLPGKFELHEDCDIIFTIISRLEMRKITNLIQDVDPKAFVFASTIKEASGGIMKKRHVH